MIVAGEQMVCELRSEVSVLRRRLARKDSDMRGLIEVLRRLREFDYFTLDGIHFFEVTESDIFGNTKWLVKFSSIPMIVELLGTYSA